MRPPRLVLLLLAFIALPIFLTFISLVSTHQKQADSLNTSYNTPSGRLRALFTFHTPTSLFPPSAVISLTNDNSTFFLSRPANFGGVLPRNGLSGQLWIGRGFGGIEDENGELGCSDVPGWDEGDQKHSDEQGIRFKPLRKKVSQAKAGPGATNTDGEKAELVPRSTNEDAVSIGDNAPKQEDGTDDYLHHPLPESNPAEAAGAGQPAAHDDHSDKTKKPTHADIQSLQEAAEIAGKVVLLSRGGCGFLEKVKWAQRRGGIALIVGDDEPGKPLITMYARGDISNVTIPALFTSHTTAHLLSSLVPQEFEELLQESAKAQTDTSQPGKQEGKKENWKQDGPTFTPSKVPPTNTGMLRPSIVPVSGQNSNKHKKNKNRWLPALSAALGGRSSVGYPWHMAEDSRRPPSSGNIDWVLLEDWDEEEPATSSISVTATGTVTKSVRKVVSSKTKTASHQHSTSAGFIIGVQDWRDPDLVVPDTKASTGSSQPAEKAANGQEKTPMTSGVFKGGSITPGSGEYENLRPGHAISDDMRTSQPKHLHDGAAQNAQSDADDSGWLSRFGWTHAEIEEVLEHKRPQGAGGPHANAMSAEAQASKEHRHHDAGDDEEQEGLWVTLTPTTVSSSPFFDTLLVLVVSPLVTLTVVYALLLLRSRIRRRRWRAPKSVVERLPVRTYHTMSTSSSATSSQYSTPATSSPTTPLLRSVSQHAATRSRPRSQTASSAIPRLSSPSATSPPPSSPPKEKPSTTKRKYTGRQVECVVCLEEYVDGQSRVMSLPCGHEFHADCM